jgi:hypothetical protein
MKILLTTIALMIAAPALAQTGGGHDAHAAHGTANHAQHEDHDKGCCAKDEKGRMACCEKMKAKEKKMACCADDAKAASSSDAHAGHGKH